MKKISLKKLLGSALLALLALDINHPVLASNDAPIDYSKLSSDDATLARLLKSQGKNPGAIRAALEKRKMESLTKGMSGLNLGSSEKDIEKITTLEKEKKSLAEGVQRKEEELRRKEEELKHKEESTKFLQMTLTKQKEEHETKLKEIEEHHTRLLQSEKKRTDELKKEIEEAEEAKEFKGIDYMTLRLKDVEDRLESLRKISDPEDADMLTFIKQGEGDLKGIKEEVEKLDVSMPVEELMGWQKKTSIFAFNFEIRALQFISKDASKKGIQLPENFYSLPIPAQEEALVSIAKAIKAEVESRAKVEKERMERETLLRKKLKDRADEEYQALTKEIDAVAYLKDQKVKAAGTNGMKNEMDKLKKYSEDDDYDKISYEDLVLREKDIGNIKAFEKGADGELVKKLRVKIDNLHKAQHPENTTNAQRKFASDLYFLLPGKAKIFATGGLGGPPSIKGPPTLTGGGSGGRGGPPPLLTGGRGGPPIPSSGTVTGGVKTIPEGENFPALYEARLTGFARNVPSILGLVDEVPEKEGEEPKKVTEYKKVVLKDAKQKIDMLNGIINNPEIAKDIKALMDGSLSEDKAYGYYLLLSTLKPATTEDISFSWQRSLPATIKAMKSLIQYVKTTTLPAELEKFSKLSTGPAKFGTGSVGKVDFFTYIDEDFKDLWKIDPDLKLLTVQKKPEDTDKKIAELDGITQGIQNIVAIISLFSNSVYGSAIPLNKLTERIAAIKTSETDEPRARIKQFKDELQKIFGEIVVDGKPLSDLKGEKAISLEASIEPLKLKPTDYHAAILLMSHFLDEDAYLKSLQDLTKQLEAGAIASPDALKKDLHDAIKNDMLKVTGGEPIVMESNKIDETKVEYFFDIKGNVFTKKEVEKRFVEIKKNLESFELKFKKAFENYKDGKSIMPPTIKLLSVSEPNLRTIFDKYNKTKIVIDEAFIAAFMEGFNEVASKMEGNKSYVTTVEKVKREYPLLVAPKTGEDPTQKGERETKLKKLVEDSFDFMQILNISKFIPPEDQAPNVPYSYVKMMLMFKAFSSGQWSNTAKESKGPSKGTSKDPSKDTSKTPTKSIIIATPTGKGSGLLTGVNLDTLNFQQLHDLADKVEKQKVDYAKSFDHKKGDLDKDLEYKALVAEFGKVTAKIDRLHVLSSFEYWEKIAPTKILTIPLAGKTGHALQPTEEKEILDFMKAIKDGDSKAKRTYTANMKKLEKYQPELHKKVLAIK
jgi:hypothetical protein